jgi:pimeloyl-ACP methyl ester carboxylesterase
MVAPPRIPRRFADLPEGQMHYREAGRERSGTPLLLLHQASGGSRTMMPLMRVIGAHRPVIAPDLPGNGDSDPLTVPTPAMTDYAAAVGHFLDALGLDRVAVYGFHAGGSVAAELALARPGRVAAVILDSLGLYAPEEAAPFADAYVPQITRDPHGTHLVRVWHYVRDTYLFWPWFRTDAEAARGVGLPPLDEMHDKVLEVLKAMDHFGHYYRAAFLHDKRAVLPELRVPTLVTAGRNNSQAVHLAALAELVPGAETLLTAGVYQPDAAAETASEFRGWLDRVAP